MHDTLAQLLVELRPAHAVLDLVRKLLRWHLRQLPPLHRLAKYLEDGCLASELGNGRAGRERHGDVARLTVTRADDALDETGHELSGSERHLHILTAGDGGQRLTGRAVLVSQEAIHIYEDLHALLCRHPGPDGHEVGVLVAQLEERVVVGVLVEVDPLHVHFQSLVHRVVDWDLGVDIDLDSE